MEIRACREKEPDDTEARGKKGIGGGGLETEARAAVAVGLWGGGISKVRGVGN